MAIRLTDIPDDNSQQGQSIRLSDIEPSDDEARGEADGLVTRLRHQLWNKTVAETIHSLVGDTEIEGMKYHAAEALQATLAEEKKKNPKFAITDALYESILKDYENELQKPPETREVESLKKYRQYKPTGEAPLAYDVSEASTFAEKAVDVGAGLTAFVSQLAVLRKAIPEVSEKALWEAQSLANGGNPGQGLAMYGVFGGAGKMGKALGGTVKGVGLGAKVAQKALEIAPQSAAMGGVTAAQGGSAEDIAIATGIPIALSGIGGLKNKFRPTEKTPTKSPRDLSKVDLSKAPTGEGEALAARLRIKQEQIIQRPIIQEAVEKGTMKIEDVDMVKPYAGEPWADNFLAKVPPPIPIKPTVTTVAEVNPLESGIKKIKANYDTALEQGLPELRRKQTTERGKRFGDYEEVYKENIKQGMEPAKAEAEARRATMGGKLVEEPFVNPPDLTAVEWSSIYNVASEATTGPTRMKVFDALKKVQVGNLPRPHEIRLLKTIFGDDFVAPMLRNLEFGDRAMYAIEELSSLFKGVQAGGEVSAIGRQGLPIASSSPGTFANLVKNVLAAYKNPKLADILRKKVHNDPQYEISKRYGVQYSEMGSFATEETFVTSQVERIQRFGRKVPILGRAVQGYARLVAGGEAAFIEPLNTARMDLWNVKVRQFEENKHLSKKWRTRPTSKDVQTLNELGSFVSNISGRAPLGKSKAVRGITTFLNVATFAPRFAWSRIAGHINPFGYAIRIWGKSPAMKKEMTKSITSFWAAQSVAALTGYLANPDQNQDIFNPLATNFMKVRVGNTRYDLTCGFGQAFREMARIASGFRVNESGELVGDFTSLDARWEEMKRFAKSKESPLISAIAELYTGRDFSGKKISRLTTVPKNFVFMFLRDAYDAYKYDGILQSMVALGISATGGGVQTYPDSPYTQSMKLKDEAAETKYNMAWDDLGPNAQTKLRIAMPEIAASEQAVRRERSESGEDIILKPEQLVLDEGVEFALKELNIPTPAVSKRIHSNYNLNDDRFETYKEKSTQYINENIDRLIKSGVWLRMSSAGKIKAIANNIEAAKSRSGMEIIKEANSNTKEYGNGKE